MKLTPLNCHTLRLSVTSLLVRDDSSIKPACQYHDRALIKFLKIVPVASLITLPLLLSACEKQPPDYRPEVTVPEYTQGDAKNGKLIYKEACSQCHQLTPGLNKKGPQLMNVYGAPAALLKDYKYSQALQDTGWTWDAETLDPYLADPEKALPDSKMLADPMPDPKERADVIAYLSTLRAPVPIVDTKDGDTQNHTGSSKPAS